MANPIQLTDRVTLSIPKYAHLCGIGEQTIRTWCLRGILPCFKVGDSTHIHVAAANEVLRHMAEESMQILNAEDHKPKRRSRRREEC